VSVRRAARLSGDVPHARDLTGGGRLAYLPAFCARDEAARLFVTLLDEVPLAERTVRLFGREVPEPRRSAWLGEPEAVYTYSGVEHRPAPLTPTLSALLARLERELGARFNAVLVNHYRDGRDSMGLHADDEPELGREPTIASVSLGGPRRFWLRPRRGQLGEALELELASGSLLVMAGALQATHLHGVPKEREAAPRLNLTFRWVEPARGRGAAQGRRSPARRSGREADKGLNPEPKAR
jgi:alkylated DNA repair dioxygenase AlkB